MLPLLLSVSYQFILRPCTTFVCLLCSWVWVKITLKEINPKEFSWSYETLYQKKQYYRILTSQFTHTTLLHLIVNLMSLWYSRQVEYHQGTIWYMFNSIKLLIIQTFLHYCIHSLLLTYSIGSSQHQLVQNFHSFGCSSICLAWHTYQFFTYQHYHTYKTLQLFGILPVHPRYVVIIMLYIYYLLLPRKDSTDTTFVGFLSGCLLYFCSTFPNIYWSICFLISFTLVMIISTSPENIFSLPVSRFSLFHGHNLETVDVFDMQLRGEGIENRMNIADLNNGRSGMNSNIPDDIENSLGSEESSNPMRIEDNRPHHSEHKIQDDQDMEDMDNAMEDIPLLRGYPSNGTGRGNHISNIEDRSNDRANSHLTPLLTKRQVESSTIRNSWNRTPDSINTNTTTTSNTIPSTGSTTSPTTYYNKNDKEIK